MLSSQRRLGSSHIAILQEVKCCQETRYIESRSSVQVVIMSILAWIPAFAGMRVFSILIQSGRLGSSHIAILQEVKCCQETRYIESRSSVQVVIMSILAWIPAFAGMRVFSILIQSGRLESSHTAILQEVKCCQETRYIESRSSVQVVIM